VVPQRTAAPFTLGSIPSLGSSARNVIVSGTRRHASVPKARRSPVRRSAARLCAHLLLGQPPDVRKTAIRGKGAQERRALTPFGPVHVGALRRAPARRQLLQVAPHPGDAFLGSAPLVPSALAGRAAPTSRV
jgi:hypothetical protein